jgi:hypothetical protein
MHWLELSGKAAQCTEVFVTWSVGHNPEWCSNEKVHSLDLLGVIHGANPVSLASTPSWAIMRIPRTYIVSSGCCYPNLSLDCHELFANDFEFQETSLRNAAGHLRTHWMGVFGIRHEHEHENIDKMSK